MNCQTSDVTNYLCLAGLSAMDVSVSQKMTLIEKLKVIKRCVEEKEFAHDLDIVRQIRKFSTVKYQCKTNQYHVKNINFGALQVVDKIGNVILNKSIVDLSTIELSHLLMLVEEPIKHFKDKKLQQGPFEIDNDVNKKKSVNFVSLFTENKKPTVIKLEYNKEQHGTRNKMTNLVNISLFGSLSF